MTGVFPCRVFFDSDAVIAGSASSTGAAHALFVLSEVGVIHGVVSPQVTEECRRNLAAKLPAALPAFNEIIAHSLAVEQSPTTAWMAKAARYAHPKDAPILAAALQARTRFLVTFNVRDFRPPRDLGIEVLRPGEMLETIRRSLTGGG